MMGIFHLLAMRRLSKIFYAILNYINIQLCGADSSKFHHTFKLFISKSTMIPTFFELYGENQSIPESVYDVAIANRFYELTTLVTELNIKLKPNLQPIMKPRSIFRHLLLKGDGLKEIFTVEPNEYNKLYLELNKLFLKMHGIIINFGLSDKLKAYENWVAILEDALFFLPHSQIIDNGKQESKEEAFLLFCKNLNLNTILLQISPEVFLNIILENRQTNLSHSLLFPSLQTQLTKIIYPIPNNILICLKIIFQKYKV